MGKASRVKRDRRLRGESRPVREVVELRQVDEDQGDDDDCEVCRALGQRVERDGSIVRIPGARVDHDAAVRAVLAGGGEWVGA